jgi:hypothetical protein
MSRKVWHVGKHPKPMLLVVTLVAIASAVVSQAQAQTQMSSKADSRPVSGEWRSREQFDNQPRATVVVQEDGGALAGSLTLLGMTRGADDRATLRVPFRDAVWDGSTLTFETALPDNEGTARWALRIMATGKATLRPTTDDGKPVEDGPMWEMSRP